MGYKLTGRYLLPWQFGVSGSLRVQSGGQWGRVTSVNFPGDGAQNVRMEAVDTNRAPNVSLLDFRFDRPSALASLARPSVRSTCST